MKFVPWIAAMLWLALRAMAGRMFAPEDAFGFGVLTNLGFILILIFITIYLKYKNHVGERPSFLDDIKDCMKSSGKYVIGVVICIACYYSFISNEKEVLFNKRIQEFETSIDTDQELAGFLKEHPELKDYTREKLIATNKERVETFFSLKILVSMALFVLILISMVYSLLGVLFWRSVVKQL